ncbi:hypothetical protein APR09_000901 [Nocardia amikacinitolerans]|nr:hypothetical protein [Nocardia amikacinitolerans]
MPFGRLDEPDTSWYASTAGPTWSDGPRAVSHRLLCHGLGSFVAPDVSAER